MTPTVRVLLIGIGGYGSNYPTWILDKPEYPVEIAAIVDPAAVAGKLNHDMNNDSNGNLQRLRDLGVPILSTLNEFFAAGGSADLAVNSTPIPYHASLTIQALQHGCRVFCEKPLCSTVQDAEAMISVAKENRRNLSVGYQVMYQDDILHLKREIVAGTYGKLLHARSINVMTRDIEYYQRVNWAGRQKMPDNTWVLDSIAHNNSAHLLNFMLFMAGDKLESAARPESICAELYRAQTIENYDSAIMKINTIQGSDIWFGVSDVGDGDPITAKVELEFTNCVITFTDWLNHGQISYPDSNSRQVSGKSVESTKIWKEIRAAAGHDDFTYPAESAMMEVLAINGAQESASIIDFPKAIVKRKKDSEGHFRIQVAGIRDLWQQCYEQRIFPSDIGQVSWARPGHNVDLRNYHFFPQSLKSKCFRTEVAFGQRLH